MRRLTLSAFAFLALCLSAAPAVADEAVSEIPFAFEKGHVVVAGKIRNDVPVEFILSTGAQHSFVDASLLKKYKLQSFYTGEPPVTGTSSDRIYSFTDVSDVRVGGASETSLRMRLAATIGASQSLGRSIFGVLGIDFFKGRVVQFDFKKKVVRFYKQPPAPGAEGVTLKMEGPNDPFRPGVTAPLVGGVTFNGKQSKLLLDTGAVTVVGLSSATARKLGFAAPPEKGEARGDVIASLRFGTYELNGVPVLISAKGTQLEQSLADHGAVAGTALLQNFVITFDFRDGSVNLAAHK